MGCSVCGRTPLAARGLCWQHYVRVRVHGTLEPSARDQTRAQISELWARVQSAEGLLDGPCWEWPGTRDGAGYGLTKRLGENRAHRAVFLLVTGDRPPMVCHRCDNPACVRPSHLFAGDAVVNAQDRESKGRGNQPRGERNGRCAARRAAATVNV